MTYTYIIGEEILLLFPPQIYVRSQNQDWGWKQVVLLDNSTR